MTILICLIFLYEGPPCVSGTCSNDDVDESLLTFFLLYGLSMIQLISQFVCAVVNAGMLQCKR